MNNEENLSPLELVKSLKFCIFDLETTGGNHKTDKIIEIGLVKVENLEITKTKNFLIQPEMKIPDFIQKLTTITQSDVKLAPIIEDVIDEILEFMDDSILVAHNTSFDVPFLNSVLRRLERPELTNKSICTNLMTKYLIPNLMNTNLNYMSRIFDISHNKAHRALDDALATTHLLLNYLNIFIDKGIQKVNHLYYPRGRFELDRINFKRETPVDDIFKKIKKIKSSFVITLKGENGVILFALPCQQKLGEMEELQKKLAELPWELLTIRLTGPFIEALIHFSGLFNKLDSSLKYEVIKFLYDKHLPSYKPTQKDFDEEMAVQLESDNFGDFIICHHLVPEQLIIYPVQALNPKSELVFRYPGHQKKLLQYLNSKSSRIDANKLKKVHHHIALKNFVNHYLLKEKEDNNLFIVPKKPSAKTSDDFFKKLDHFLEGNPNPFSFPRDYI